MPAELILKEEEEPARRREERSHWAEECYSMCEGPQFGEHRARLEGLRSCMSETEGGMRGGWRGKRDGASLLEADDNIVWQVDHDQHL